MTLPKENQLFYIGNIVGIRNSNDSMSKIDKNNLKKVFQSGVSVDSINKLEGRFLMMLCNFSSSNAMVQVFTDRYGQFDCYYYTEGDKAVFASDFSLFPEPPSRDGYDQIGFAHALTVYGYRPAKKHTIYKNVHRLGVGEISIIKSDEIKFKQLKFKPIEIGNYKEDDLNRYADLFLSALKIRGSDKGNVVYL